MLLDDNCAACAPGGQASSSFVDPCCGLPTLPSWATSAASCDEPGCGPGGSAPPDNCPTCVVGGLGLITNDGEAVHAQPQPTMALHGELPGSAATAAASASAAPDAQATAPQVDDAHDGLEGLLKGLDDKTIQDIVRLFPLL